MPGRRLPRAIAHLIPVCPDNDGPILIGAAQERDSTHDHKVVRL
jgi:hypothetical protein